MKPEVIAQVKDNEVLFFGAFKTEEEMFWLASIPLSDTLELIKEKTSILLQGLMDIAGVAKPQFLIHDLLDKKGVLKDLKVQVYEKNRKRWVYTDARGIKRTREYDTGMASIDITFYAQKLMTRYNVPEGSCTAHLIVSLVKSLTLRT